MTAPADRPGPDLTGADAATRPEGSPPRRPAPSVPWGAFALDVLLVLLFATIGRLSHTEGLTFGGLVTTASPFLAGTVAAWAGLAALGRPRPASIAAGLAVWAATLVIGMLLRAVTGQGVQVSFVIVAAVANALFLLGWRAAGWWSVRRQRR